MTTLPRRFLSLLIGLFLYAVGIVATMKANLGYAPWEVFHRGIGEAVGMTLGNVSILVGLVIVLVTAALGEKIGLGTILNMVLIGVFIDIIWWANLIPTATETVAGLATMVAGLFTISFAAFLCIRAGLGAGPRDSLMVAIQRKTGLPVGLCRGLMEGAAVFVGWRLSGPVGLGTVLAAFGISFCIQATFSLLRFEATSVEHETLNATLRGLRALCVRDSKRPATKGQAIGARKDA